MRNIGDLIKEHTVVVDGGSGVLIQPMTDEDSYILTAKHNILVNSEESESATKVLAGIKIKTINGDELQAKKIYRDQSLDIAVILIDRYTTELKVYPYQGQLNSEDDIWLYGYPGRLRLKSPLVNDWIEKYDLKLHESSSSTVTFRNRESALYAEIKGFSGGGIFHVNEAKEQCFLAGIENKMSSHGEYVDRIVGIPIVAFDGLLKENDLAPLKPLHLVDFKYLSDKIFPLRNCVNPTNLTSVKELLTHLANKKLNSANITPIKILEKFESKLLVYKSNKSELEEANLWVAILELLVLNSLIDASNQWTEEHLKNLFETFRLVYIKSNYGWKGELDKIFFTSTEGVVSGGKMIVIIGGDLPSTPIISKEFIKKAVPDISNANSEEAIDNPFHSRIISGDITIIHWLKLHQECIEDKEFDFKELNLMTDKEDIIRVLDENYSIYFNNGNINE